MVTIAVIPARGGSKRIYRKNVADLCGRPLMYWTIKAAMNAECIDQVFVSSDDTEMLGLAESWGAEHFGLREKSRGPRSPSAAVSADTAALYSSRYGGLPDNVFQLLPTCPFRSDRDIELFFSKWDPIGPIDCAVSVVEPPGFNLNWLVGEERGRLAPLEPELWSTPSQNLPKKFVASGGIWLSKGKTLIERRTFYGPQTKYVEISWLAGFDIDTQKDLEFARQIGPQILLS